MIKYITDFIKQNKITKSFYESHISKFNECEASRLLCDNCKGLYTCAQKSCGERLGLLMDGSLIQTIEYCEYKLKLIDSIGFKNKYLYSDIPEQLYTLDLTNIAYEELETKELLAVVYDIYKGKSNRGLYITGGMGVGKTYMMIALSNSLVKDGKQVVFANTSNLINNLRRMVASAEIEYDRLIYSLKTCEYLFLDDIGSESVSTYSRDDILFNILNYRMENKLMTFFTSNYDKNQLKEHYTFVKSGKSETIQAERLIERIDILGESYILKGRNKRRQND